MLKSDQEPREPFCDDYENYRYNPMPIQLRPKETYPSEPSDEEEEPEEKSGEEDQHDDSLGYSFKRESPLPPLHQSGYGLRGRPAEKIAVMH